MLSDADVEKLAALSRMKLSEAEKKELKKDLDSILGYVEDIKGASASFFEQPDLRPSHRNVFRGDASPHESGIFTEALLNEAPAREGALLKVKKIL